MNDYRMPLFTPTSTRDLQRNLAVWYASREAQRWAAARNQAGLDEQGPEFETVDLTVERHRLLAAETFLVTDEMSAVCRQAGQSLPEIIADRSVLPAECGFMVFNDRPAEHDDRLIPLPVQAVSWWPGSYYGTSGVCVQSYLWPDTARAVMDRMAILQDRLVDHKAEIDFLERELESGQPHAQEDLDTLMATVRVEADRTEAAAALTESRRLDDYLAYLRLPILPTLLTYLPYGQPPPADAIADKETDYTVRMILAAWLLMDQPLVARERPSIDRAAAKRATRAGLLSDLTVVMLRQSKNSGTGGGGREYHQRWIVRGHWRRIPTPEHPSRVTWVHGYVKGPHDAPLVMKDRVTVLAR